MSRLRTKFAVSLLLAGLFIQPALGQTDFSKFPLTKGIPADVFIAIASRGNPERKFLDDHWARVFRAFHESGVIGDVWEMISDAMEDEQAEKVDAIKEKFTGLCMDVHWGEIFGTESVHAGRYVSPIGGSPYEGILLGRTTKDQAEHNYNALKALLQEFANLIDANGGKGAVSVTESHKDDFTMAVFGPTGLNTLGIAVGYWKDVVVIGFGGLGLMDDSIKLLKGSTEIKSLVASDRFKKAFAKLPPAEDHIVFWDQANMIGQIKQMIETFGGAPHAKKAAAKQAKSKPRAAEEKDADADEDEPADKPQKGKTAKAKPKAKPAEEDADDEDEDASDEEAVNGMAIVAKVLQEVSIIDYVAVVEWTDGYSVHKESYTALSPDAKSKGLYKIVSGQEPIRDYEKLIPKEAKNFSVGSGINWVSLYHWARDFFSENIPGGAKHLAEFDRLQSEQWELNIEKDVLSLIAGAHVSVEMGSDTVWLIRVTDEKKTMAQLDRLFNFVTEKAGKEGGLMITDVEIGGKAGFKQFSHPALMMMGGVTPVIGCAENYLCIGTSAKGVRTVLETVQGKHPNITKSEQWLKESVRPKSGPVDSISFEDQTGMAEQLQGMIGGVSMALGMVGMFGQDMPSELRGMLSKLPPLLAKLGPVAGKMDFFQSKSSYVTSDDNGWHEREVQNYKGPRPPGEDEDEAKAKSDDDEKPARKPAHAKPKAKPKPKKEESDDDE